MVGRRTEVLTMLPTYRLSLGIRAGWIGNNVHKRLGNNTASGSVLRCQAR